MTPDQREKARLRSERWRRAHGIMPRKPAQRRGSRKGSRRSTWYRRGNRISPNVGDLKNATVAHLEFPHLWDLTRAESLALDLARDLARCVAAHAVMQRELARL